MANPNMRARHKRYTQVDEQMFYVFMYQRNDEPEIVTGPWAIFDGGNAKIKHNPNGELTYYLASEYVEEGVL